MKILCKVLIVELEISCVELCNIEIRIDGRRKFSVLDGLFARLIPYL
jgi:hypothetical protein